MGESIERYADSVSLYELAKNCPGFIQPEAPQE
jgi:hypothetical protein